MSGKKFFVVGNWKMNGSTKQADTLINMLNTEGVNDETEVVIAPPICYLSHVRQGLNKKLGVAAQNCYKCDSGAFTGFISPSMIQDVGCEWVILGHLEHRYVFGESDQLVTEKIRFALASGLKVIVAVGEKVAEREAGEEKIHEVVFRQIKAFAEHVTDWDRIVIAYEAGWTDGSVQLSAPMTPYDAQHTMHHIRAWMSRQYGAHTADCARIIYGGSINSDNCRDYASQADIDGLLVGKAALTHQFIDIINSNANTYSSVFKFWKQQSQRHSTHITV